jgi:hypothetical protein
MGLSILSPLPTLGIARLHAFTLPFVFATFRSTYGNFLVNRLAWPLQFSTLPRILLPSFWVASTNNNGHRVDC